MCKRHLETREKNTHTHTHAHKDAIRGWDNKRRRILNKCFTLIYIRFYYILKVLPNFTLGLYQTRLFLALQGLV